VKTPKARKAPKAQGAPKAVAVDTATRDERVVDIATRMAEGRWRRYLTTRELAVRWGVSESTVNGYASDASRLLRIPKEEREALQAQQYAFLESIMHDAAVSRSVITGLPDYRHILQAWEMYQKYVLANWGKQEEGAPPAELSDTELEALAKLFAKDLLSKREQP
jgi:DNA-binding CsgD family transcriptional regulator